MNAVKTRNTGHKTARILSSWLYWRKQSINQSINRTNNQSNDQSINQSNNQTNKRTNIQTNNQSNNQSMRRFFNKVGKKPQKNHKGCLWCSFCDSNCWLFCFTLKYSAHTVTANQHGAYQTLKNRHIWNPKCEATRDPMKNKRRLIGMMFWLNNWAKKVSTNRSWWTLGLPAAVDSQAGRPVLSAMSPYFSPHLP